MPRPKIFANSNQRHRVWSRARTFAASPVREIAVKQGETEARLIVARLAKRGIAATAEQRGEVWIVRKEGSE